MADPPPFQRGGRRHLDASGPREVVYCHQCDNEWYRDEHGLICPRCDCGATEIITADNDPRSTVVAPDHLDDIRQLHNHNPWPDDDVPDPDEGDVEEYITHGPGGRTTFISQTFTTHGPRGPAADRNRRPMDPNDPANVIRDFQTMIGHFMGPGLHQGQAGRSGPDNLFPRGEPEGFRRRSFSGRMGGGNDGPHYVGQRVMFSTGRRPRDPEVQNVEADEFATILGGLFGAMGPLGQMQHLDGEANGPRIGMPPGLQGLFASILNPANAVAGDAVYSNEALDRIISTLMEQHPQSNAPGPASQEAIASLPKKSLDEKMLGPELKAECSVCMDDVTVGDEVVVLPCKHWFHQACASAWLSEHNTCPICRTGISNDQPPSNTETAHSDSLNAPSPPSDDETRTRRRSSFRRSPTNEARLNAIRERGGRLSPTPESTTGQPRRFHIISEPVRQSRHRTPSPPPLIPMGRSSPFRPRDLDISDGQRESRRASGSDRSHRSTNSANTADSGGGNGGGGGPMSWLRRLGGVGRRNE